MLDPVIAFFSSIFQLIGAAIGKFILLLLSPFIWIRNLYRSSGWILKVLIAVLLLCIIIPYGYFIWNVSWIRSYDTNYTAKFDFKRIEVQAGEELRVDGGTDSNRTCGRSGIVEVATELVDFNVNQNVWISASLPYRLGLFGISWDSTPWMDNKATFQRGVHRAVKATTIELQEALGRERGTSERDKNLNKALGLLQISEYNWYVGLNPPGVKQTSWSSYRGAITEFKQYNSRLEKCNAAFDARADNLSGLMDRIAKDIGSTTAVIKSRAESHNGGWFDMRADNTFMEAHGQLYAYLGILKAARSDFNDIIEKRALDSLWANMIGQLENAVELNPLIISNGDEDGFVMPTHLTTMGFYILRVRTNLTEMRDVLKS